MAAYAYILASRRNGTLYIGVTNDLVRRVWEHKEAVADGFKKRYGVKMLVYYEECAGIVEAIQREKTMKHWVRQWKLNAIEAANPEWRDLWPGTGDLALHQEAKLSHPSNVILALVARTQSCTCRRSLGPRNKSEDDARRVGWPR